MDKKTRLNIIYAVVAVWVILLFQSWWINAREVQQIPYSEFEQLLEDGKVAEVAITQDSIQGTLRGSSVEPLKKFKTTRVDAELTEQLNKYGVVYSGVIESTFFRDLLSWILPVLFFVAIWMFVIRRFAEKQGFGGMMSVGKSKAKVYVETDIKVSFNDVAGVDEAKDELEEIVEFLKHPDQYGRLGARIPKGILLVGPPGTGKTLLARAVAGEAGVPFFSISGSEFVEMFVGVGAARVRDLFEQAQKAAPCIIFIDELDALGRARSVGGFGGGHDEKEQTLNQLLSELDGFDPRQGIVLLAATNRPEILDPALLRAGRFDRQVLVDRPDKPGRAAILEVHVQGIELAEDVNLQNIAALTPGFSGADLANLVNEAAILATRRGAGAVAMEHFTAAIERIVGGLEKKSRLLNPHERKVVAFHEMGHALVATALPGMDPVHKISIIPRGVGALGYTMQRPTEDRFLVTQSELENKMAVLLGGRAAEQIVFEEVSTGAADDLEKASEIARHMVTRFGMSEKLGQVTYEMRQQAFLGEGVIGNSERREYSEETARNIDRCIRELTDHALKRAREVLTTYRRQLDEGAARLLERETLTSGDLPRLTDIKAPKVGQTSDMSAA
ncbi:ATP-dependent zinc metalloprotease FtsH [Pelagibius sp. Alg239-R121]|uniref:ATP-dependent zinc metalloprotease FtsH n=1 Tax=Pelagibius sp. Alg239-R121 TaxID=2993448 RepID=UPI0024A767FC|nr:ATP-dependent zinc metalloprotease FtsH [Pelagibius sp. Alg239-R121]